MGVSPMPSMHDRGWSCYSSQQFQLGHASVRNPLNAVNVPRAIPDSLVRRHEFPFNQLLRLHVRIAALLRIRVIAQVANEVVVLIEDRESALQVRDQDVAAALIEVARMAQFVID